MYFLKLTDYYKPNKPVYIQAGAIISLNEIYDRNDETRSLGSCINRDTPTSYCVMETNEEILKLMKAMVK